MPPGIRQALGVLIGLAIAAAACAQTSTPAEFQKVIESDYAKWGKIVRASGARVD